MPKLSTLSLSLGAAFALAPAASAPLAAQQGVPACTGPQAVELRSIDLETGTGRSATVRGTGAYAHCSWATDSSGRLNVQLPLAALPTLDSSSVETCSLPVVSALTEVTADPVVVEVLLVDPTPAVEGLLVWRGTVRTASQVPSWSEQVCAEARQRQSLTEAASATPLPEVGWGIPGLDEIEALVRGSSEVQALLAEGAAPPESDTEALPAIVREEGIPVRQGARVILLDSSETTADPTRHVHLIVREATPTAVQVAVDTGEGGQIELRWIRSIEAPEWTLAKAI